MIPREEIYTIQGFEYIKSHWISYNEHHYGDKLSLDEYLLNQGYSLEDIIGIKSSIDKTFYYG